MENGSTTGNAGATVGKNESEKHFLMIGQHIYAFNLANMLLSFSTAFKRLCHAKNGNRIRRIILPTR